MGAEESSAVAKRVWSQGELEAVSLGFEEAEPQQVLEWAIREFHPGITLACSFGGASGMALLDMALRIEPRLRVFYVDTGCLFPETYALRDLAAARYGFQPLGVRPILTLEEQAAKHGPALWERDPDLCCEMRKVEPNARALEGQRAWIAGLRRDQGDTRRDVPIVSWDTRFQLVKVNPLARWTEERVWRYIEENDVPYNPLHDRGYPSIGCTFCTRPVSQGEDPRAGRWSSFEKTECGIHLPGQVPAASGSD